jgi:hypothetical protein
MSVRPVALIAELDHLSSERAGEAPGKWSLWYHPLCGAPFDSDLRGRHRCCHPATPLQRGRTAANSSLALALHAPTLARSPHDVAGPFILKRVVKPIGSAMKASVSCLYVTPAP